MIGAAHKIVRHPDMPRSIFKYFWETLQSGSLIGAYVKNKDAKGQYYWVFAAAFPLKEGYLSIRLRPSSELFTKMKDIYARILDEEKKSDMNGGLRLLNELLHAEGFSSYQDFSAQALRMEILARDSTIEAKCSAMNDKDQAQANPESSQSQLEMALGHIRSICSRGTSSFQTLFSLMDDFAKTEKSFSSGTSQILESFRKMQFLSFNMIIASEKLGHAGSTLAVISVEFQRLSEKIETSLNDFVQSADQITTRIQRSSLNISALKLQMDMVDFFIRESLEKTQSGAITVQEAFQDINLNREDFIELSKCSVDTIRNILGELAIKLEQFEKTMTKISRLINSLEIVRQMGAVETSRSQETQEAFIHQIDVLKEFTTALMAASSSFSTDIQNLARSAETISKKVLSGGSVLQDIFSAAEGLQASEDTSTRIAS